MEKFIKSCAATFLILALPAAMHAQSHKPKRNQVNKADACLDKAEKENGWAKIGSLVCVIGDIKGLEKRIDIQSAEGGDVFAGVSIVDANGIPIRRVEVDFYPASKFHPAELSVGEWVRNDQIGRKILPIAQPENETLQGLLADFKRAVGKSTVLMRFDNQ